MPSFKLLQLFGSKTKRTETLIVEWATKHPIQKLHCVNVGDVSARMWHHVGVFGVELKGFKARPPDVKARRLPIAERFIAFPSQLRHASHFTDGLLTRAAAKLRRIALRPQRPIARRCRFRRFRHAGSAQVAEGFLSERLEIRCRLNVARVVPRLRALQESGRLAEFVGSSSSAGAKKISQTPSPSERQRGIPTGQPNSKVAMSSPMISGLGRTPS